MFGGVGASGAPSATPTASASGPGARRTSPLVGAGGVVAAAAARPSLFDTAREPDEDDVSKLLARPSLVPSASASATDDNLAGLAAAAVPIRRAGAGLFDDDEDDDADASLFSAAATAASKKPPLAALTQVNINPIARRAARDALSPHTLRAH